MGSSQPVYQTTIPTESGINRQFVILFTCLIGIEFLFVVLDLTVNWWKWSPHGPIRRLFNMTREDGLPSVFAVIQTFVIALVAWAIYLTDKFRGNPQKPTFAWALIAIFFTYMALDDGAMIHERIGTVYKNSGHDKTLLTYGWHFAVAPAFAIAGLLMFFFLWKYSQRKILRLVLILALSCLAIAMSMDFIEGIEDGYAIIQSISGTDTKTIAHFSKSIEEFLEMIGMSLFLILFLQVFQDQISGLQITIQK